jgi:aminopeptidase-like protein
VIGSEYYLNGLQEEAREKILEGLFLEMLGSRTPMALQESMSGNTNIEHALAKIMNEIGVPHRKGPYRSIVVNGEYIWDAYGIPMASLSRYPYPEYHTDRDNPSIISEQALDEAVQTVLRAIDFLEQSPVVFKKFKGSICTSNPRYGLYVDPGQVAFGGFNDDETMQRMRYLMELIPSLNRPVSVRVLAEKTQLSEKQVLEYLNKWANKGLVILR